MNNGFIPNNKNEEELKEYFNEIKDFEVLTREEEQHLLQKAKKGVVSAKDKLIKCNLKLVVSIVLKWFNNYDISIMDLISEGNLGLILAIDNYDFNYNVKFSSYAYRVIYDKIRRYLQANLGTVRIAYNKQDMLNKYQKIKEDLYKKYGYNLTPLELANYLNKKIEDILELEKLLAMEPNRYSTFLRSEGIKEEDKYLNCHDENQDPEVCFLKKYDDVFTSSLIDSFDLSDLEKEVLKKYIIDMKSFSEIGVELNSRNYKAITFLVYNALKKIRNSPYNNLILSRYIYGTNDISFLALKLKKNPKTKNVNRTIYQILNIPKEIVDEAIKNVVDNKNAQELLTYRFGSNLDDPIKGEDFVSNTKKARSYYALQGKIKKEALRLLEEKENMESKII